MGKFQDLSGEKYNRWTVLNEYKITNQTTFWLCECQCGTRIYVRSGTLKNGSSKSCGCFKSETTKRISTKHGKTGIPEYEIWKSMKQRCLNPQNKTYHHYGGRGITVCKRWYKFENFFDDMGKKPSSKHSLERRDNDGNYEPDNCYWATIKQQRRNTRRKRLLTLGNKTLTLVEWAEIKNIPRGTLSSRINQHNWPPEKALTTPVRKQEIRMLEYNGETKPLSEWAEEYGLKYITLHARIYHHDWPIEKALTTPSRNN